MLRAGDIGSRQPAGGVREVIVRGFLCGVLLGAVGLCGESARADYILDVQAFPASPFDSITSVFPNWVQAPTGSFMVLQQDDVDGAGWCEDSAIIGVTIYNYGTATGSAKGGGGDIEGMYFWIKCGSTDSGLQTMTYAGDWTVGAKTYPAWTWAGSITFIGDPSEDWGGGSKGCGLYRDRPWVAGIGLYVYSDISPCPTEGATVEVGPGYNDLLNPGCPGGVYDWDVGFGWSCGSCGNWAAVREPTVKTIRYQWKEADRATASPGDTINYTIFVGKPGTSYTNLVVMDTQPTYTHLVPGSDVPPADPGYDPDPGPPMRLRWTLPGGASGGGPTEEIRFSVTVDWGNTDVFEPGSGDVAAPENERLGNQAQAFWEGIVGCGAGTKTSVSPATETVIQRFLFWKIADNDVLFAPRIGMPDDEVTYEIVIKNLSTKKAWWDVVIWDTVPDELDAWGPGGGFYDPCVGWTMTPTGCAAASPGTIVSGPTTLLTWRINLPPGATVTLKWKARVKGSTAPDSTAMSTVSVLALGRPGIVGGTGDSQRPVIFTHSSAIILRTTYLSYISITGGTKSFFSCCNDDPLFATQTYFLSFYPLNKMTNFALYEQVHQGDAFAKFGGLSPPISVYAGGCLTASPSWVPGCKAERAPAFYKPVEYGTCKVPVPFHDLFKVVSNSPLTWEMLTGDIDGGSEVSTYCPTTSLTYRGYAAYSYARICASATNTDGFFCINTSPAGPTNVRVFSWDAPTLSWQYLTGTLIDRESVWFFLPTVQNSYKFISSDYPIIIWKGLPETSGNWYRTMAPQKETGYLVSSVTPSNFYAFSWDDAVWGGALIVGNMGTVDATYSVWQYKSNNPSLPMISGKHQTPFLVGNSGAWTRLRQDDVVPAGQLNPLNPHAYQLGYDTGVVGSSRTFYKVELTSGGPVEVYCGRGLHSSYDGAMCLNATGGKQSGYDFWFHHTARAAFTGDCDAIFWATMSIDLFMPKQGTVVQGYTGDGYTATFTTDGVDECVSFKALTPPAEYARRNWRFQSTGGIIAVCVANTCVLQQKMFTGPFVATGVHYDVIAPPVAYAGQLFWLTIVVVNAAGGGTKTDYDGTTAFTSTDPSAMLEGMGMNLYSYTWVPATDGGVRIFVNVVFNQLGIQTFIASDVVDGSITGLAVVVVVGVDVKLFKEPRISVRASGDTVKFKVCWSNYSTSSAFNFTITDAVPEGTSYVPDAANVALCGSTNALVEGTDYFVAFSTSTSTTAPATLTAVTGGASPPLATRWLRWTISEVGVNSTGCACYRVKVN